MLVGVVGINHKIANLKLRELLAKVCHRRFGAGQSMHPFILLSTCNRTELYFSSDDLAKTHSDILSVLRQDVKDLDDHFDQKLYSYFGQDCFLHLARVTTGLDSAIVAETEIQGQVKTAYENHTEYTTLPKPLHYMFQKCLKVGKHVRTELPIARGMPDLEHAIFNTGEHFFSYPKEAKILFVGASDINRKVLCFLISKGFTNMTICNRSQYHAQDLAETYGIDILNWKQLNHWHRYDWVIFGTKSGEHLIKKETIPGDATRLVIDLSVPRNVDPSLGRCSNVTLLNIDQLDRMLNFRRKKMTDHLIDAEQCVFDATYRQITLYREKELQRQRMLAVGA